MYRELSLTSRCCRESISVITESFETDGRRESAERIPGIRVQLLTTIPLLSSEKTVENSMITVNAEIRHQSLKLDQHISLYELIMYSKHILNVEE